MHRAALAALGASAFVYVTAETIPIGLLPQIADGLDVTEAQVGLLLTSYAVVAGVTTIPLTAITMRIPRHLLIIGTVAIFAVSHRPDVAVPEGFSDKPLHALAYLGLSAIVVRALAGGLHGFLRRLNVVALHDLERNGRRRDRDLSAADFARRRKVHDLEAAKRRNAGKPGITHAQMLKELGLKPSRTKRKA